MTLEDLLEHCWEGTRVHIVNLSGIGAARYLTDMNDGWTVRQVMDELPYGMYELEPCNAIEVTVDGAMVIYVIERDDEE